MFWPFQQSAPQKMFPLGPYRLDTEPDLTTLNEFTSEEYQNAQKGKQLNGDRAYIGVEVSLLDHSWQSMVQTFDHKVCKITLYDVFENRTLAENITQRLLNYATDMLLKRPLRKRAGLYVWHTKTDMALFQTGATPAGTAINFSVLYRNIEKRCKPTK